MPSIQELLPHFFPSPFKREIRAIIGYWPLVIGYELLVIDYAGYEENANEAHNFITEKWNYKLYEKNLKEFVSNVS